MKLAVVIDPIEKLNPKKDSTIAMLQAASTLGLELYYMCQHDMFVEHGKPKALLTNICITPNKSPWFTVKKSSIVSLSEMDIILMRKDPPFDLNYIYSTYLLELAENDGVLVVNKPQSLRDANEKYFCTLFPECSPQTLISQNNDYLKQFWQTHKNVIYKPLDGMGGHSIFHVNQNGKNLNVILDTLTQNQTIPIMAQEYLPAIKSSGDKRILIIDDYIVPYTLARIPQGDDPRGNLAKGAKGEVLPITEHERGLAKSLLPTLKRKGLIFVGIDIIGEYITEINVTSPTCIIEIEQETNEKIALSLVEKIIQIKEKNLQNEYAVT